MTRKDAARDRKQYVVGIDVGTNSVGLAAIEVSDDGTPLNLLSTISQLHDSGVLEHKTAQTRLAAAGVARRTRRLRRRRSARLIELDRWIEAQGWDAGAVTRVDESDPYAPWRARALLATDWIHDDAERGALLAIALRHMARHRGWRNPYIKASSFYVSGEPSGFFIGFRDRVEDRLGRVFGDDVTVAELAVAAVDHDRHIALRMGNTANRRQEKPFSYLGGKLWQVDNANELHAYARVQGLSVDTLRTMIDKVFAAESPRGSWVSKIGRDPLDGAPRAPKATEAFQHFRLVQVLANVRVRDGANSCPLTLDERVRAYEFLKTAKPGTDPTWTEVGKALGFTRGALGGTAALDEDAEERLPLRPPLLKTDQTILSAKKMPELTNWWREATAEARDALILLLTDGAKDETTQGGVAAWDLLNSLDEETLTALDTLELPAGRAAYSISSMRRLTDRMLTTPDDLHEARKAVFGVDDSWVPPAEPINAPVGNPAVDRVTKIVGRWLRAAESQWGAPAQVTIEHVRDAFMSESASRERDREMRRRHEAAEKQRLQIMAGERDAGRVRNSDVRRFQAITRQKGQCAYCGDTITFTTSEMDHVVPRRGIGSTNTRTNLLAVCVPCNRSKGSIPFAVWAERSNRPGVSVSEAITRVRFWTRDPGSSPQAWSRFKKEVTERLQRTDEDAEIDARSMESVAWMANELHERIKAHFHADDTKVSVYQGAITAGAREAAGIAARIPFIGGGSKTRLDRRHHAVDAATVALLDESVARTLAERSNLRSAQFFRADSDNDWRDHTGSSPAARDRFVSWQGRMHVLADLLGDAFEQDRVVVQQNLRLRLGSGKAHDDTVRPLVRRSVSGALTRDQIDAASTPALWTALTRDPDFDAEVGLPENPQRVLRLRGRWLQPDDEIEFFDKPRAAIAVRGGWAQLGDSIHHARIYRWEERGKIKYGMLRVFTADLIKHRNTDLFKVEPDPSWISMRTAHSSIGRADLSQKDYLGWLVPGDELLVDMTRIDNNRLSDLDTVLGVPKRMRWRFVSADAPMRVVLKPALLADEGLGKWAVDARPSESHLDSITKLASAPGWVVAVNEVFGKGNPVVIRRDALGRPRLSSQGLPVTWRVT